MKYKINYQEELSVDYILIECLLTGEPLIKRDECVAKDYFEKKGCFVLKYPFQLFNGNFQLLTDYIGKKSAEELKNLSNGFLDFFIYDYKTKKKFFLESKGDTSGLSGRQLNFIRTAKKLGFNSKVFKIIYMGGR